MTLKFLKENGYPVDKQKEQKAIELTTFITNYTPSGWKEPIGKVAYVHSFSWYEIEAIEAWQMREEEGR